MNNNFHTHPGMELRLHVPDDHCIIDREFIKNGDFFDGFHTMEELYDHRITLFITLCKYLRAPYAPNIWRSKVNGDGTTWDGWFVMGVGKEIGKQITYHLPIRRWSETDFVEETLDQAPEFDGHSSQDVLDRLKTL